MDEFKLGPGTVGFTFPAQKQFLTKLAIQAMPLSNVPKGTAPFSMYATTTSVGGKQIEVSDPATASSALFAGLKSGSWYVFRLVCTNPAGTTQGKASQPILTIPDAPPKLKAGKLRPDCIELVFPPQGQFLTLMKVHASLYRPDSQPWGEGTFGQFEVGHPTTCKSVVVNRLKPGTKYIFRLETKNVSGGSTGETCEPILTLPAPPPRPSEDTKARTDTQITLRWSPLGQYLTKLKLQYAIMNGKQTFQKMEGGKEVEVKDPRNAKTYVCKNLIPDKNYVFRLIAVNASGESVGEIGGPVKTVEFAPDQLDKSGFLFQLPKRDGKKTIGRRLSMKKKKPTRFWFVLDGKLLSWYNDVEDKEEVGFVHLGKIREVQANQVNGNCTLKLVAKDGKDIELMVESTDPNTSSEELMTSWQSSIEGAILGTNEPKNEEVKAMEPEIVRKGAAPTIAPPGMEGEEEAEAVAAEDEFDMEGFGMADGEEEALGFGDGEELGFGEEEAGDEEFGF